MDNFPQPSPPHNPINPGVNVPTTLPPPEPSRMNVQTMPAIQSPEAYQAPSSQAQGSTPVTGAARPRRPWLIPVIVVAVVLVLGGTTLVLAEAGVLPFSLPFRLPFALPFITPQKGELLTRMLDALPSIKSAEYSATVAAEAQPKGIGDAPLDLNAFFKAQQEATGQKTSLYNDRSYAFLPTDLKFDLTVRGKSEKEKEGKPTDVEVGLAGTYASGGTSFSGDLEVRKVGETSYVNIKKFPNLFFFDTSAIQNKWVAITEDDVAAGSSSSLGLPLSYFQSQEDGAAQANKDAVEQIKAIIRTAVEEKLIGVNRSLGVEEIEGQEAEHLSFRVELANASAFYDAIIVGLADRFGDRAFFRSSDNTRKFLTSDAFKQFTGAINKNAKVDLWIDPRTAYPAKFQFQLTMTPNADSEKFKDVQFVLTIGSTFKNINKSVKVAVPDSVIPYDEAERLLSGKSKEEQQFEKQIARVQDVRDGLREYQSLYGEYPEDLKKIDEKLRSSYDDCLNDRLPATNANANKTLGALTPFSIEMIGNSNTDDQQRKESKCYRYKSFAKGVKIEDVYSGKTYGYIVAGDDYQLSYELKFSEDIPDYAKEEYADGKNTATSKDMSVEKVGRYENLNANRNSNANGNLNTNTNSIASPDSDSDGINDDTERQRGSDPEKSDTDGDGLPDYDELYKYKTSPTKTDTDGDGYDDRTEVTGGYNPGGTGQVTDAQRTAWSRVPSFVDGPTIAGIAAAVSPGQTTISWSTDVAADGIVNFGETNAYGKYRSNTAFTKTQSISIPTEAGKTYHYAIRSCTKSPDSRCSNSADKVFTAP